MKTLFNNFKDFDYKLRQLTYYSIEYIVIIGY